MAYKEQVRPPIRRKVAMQKSGLRLGIPEIPAPDFGAVRQEYEQIDCWQFDAAVQALGKLTADEIDLLSTFACLAVVATAEQRSWRVRLFLVLEEILKLNTQHLAFVVTYARSINTADACGLEPLSPFFDYTLSTPNADLCKSRIK